MAIIGTLMLATGIVSADSAQDAQAAKTSMAQQVNITIEQAILTASKTQPDTVRKAELEKEHGSLMWKCKLSVRMPHFMKFT